MILVVGTDTRVYVFSLPLLIQIISLFLLFEYFPALPLCVRSCKAVLSVLCAVDMFPSFVDTQIFCLVFVCYKIGRRRTSQSVIPLINERGYRWGRDLTELLRFCGQLVPSRLGGVAVSP